MRPILAVVILLVVGAALFAGVMRLRSREAAETAAPDARAPTESAAPTAQANPAATVELPVSVAGWSAGGLPARYDPQSIYSYIDGHAEVYLAYGMKACTSRRYTGPAGEADLVADVFELASPEDAFGVFTHDRDGEPVDVGEGALFRFGWLSFWKGRYFVSIVAESETSASKEAAIALARMIAAVLPAGGRVPEVLSALPADGLDARTTRFLRHPQILNTHVFVSDDNLLNLGPETSAALGTYRRAGARAFLLIVDYPDEARASGAESAFRRGLLGSSASDGAVAVGDRGFFAVRRAGPRLAAAIGADTAALAGALLAEAVSARGVPARAPGGRP